MESKPILVIRLCGTIENSDYLELCKRMNKNIKGYEVIVLPNEGVEKTEFEIYR